MRTRGKVLVVDDKYYIRQLMLTALRLKGYDVLAAADGREGLTVAARERPAVILLDLLMPVMNGFKMLRELRGREEVKDTPVVVMSAEGCPDMLEPELDVQDWLFKPFDLDVMEAMVARFALPGNQEDQEDQKHQEDQEDQEDRKLKREIRREVAAGDDGY